MMIRRPTNLTASPTLGLFASNHGHAHEHATTWKIHHLHETSPLTALTTRRRLVPALSSPPCSTQNRLDIFDTVDVGRAPAETAGDSSTQFSSRFLTLSALAPNVADRHLNTRFP
ncbi:hypothetical protein BS50DRAFT_204930 [Corynespora cassiicola Philippines]|uniref:Uncharacterized protein n=1 Tax=Corynespora cassiicola Philippines TaxID=1448308 RepID=A0A2T2N6F1_CORCC|nr:hypothetical protein BS50DRAFT_204930 [Corynespora cassiicola Philippines]